MWFIESFTSSKTFNINEVSYLVLSHYSSFSFNATCHRFHSTFRLKESVCLLHEDLRYFFGFGLLCTSLFLILFTLKMLCYFARLLGRNLIKIILLERVISPLSFASILLNYKYLIRSWWIGSTFWFWLWLNWLEQLLSPYFCPKLQKPTRLSLCFSACC